jgi:hypothetical protein
MVGVERITTLLVANLPLFPELAQSPVGKKVGEYAWRKIEELERIIGEKQEEVYKIVGEVVRLRQLYVSGVKPE